VAIDRTYQLNTGGNTDFLNMLNRERLVSKKISKTEAVQSMLDIPIPSENIHIGPSDYVPWQKDNKVCFIRLEGRIFGDVPINLELRLSVEDSPNSAGCMIDAIPLLQSGAGQRSRRRSRSISAYYHETSSPAIFLMRLPEQWWKNLYEAREKDRYVVVSSKIGHAFDPFILKILSFYF